MESKEKKGDFAQEEPAKRPCDQEAEQKMLKAENKALKPKEDK
jgi:hypothetical protein